MKIELIDGKEKFEKNVARRIQSRREPREMGP
jgi:hypothetical protein